MLRPPLFPALGAESPLAGVQFRQTLALGLVPLGLALLLMAAVAPDWPPAGLWFGAAAVPAGMATLWVLWRRAGCDRLRGYSTAHYLVRYLFVVLCPALLWFAFGATLLELAGALPPVLFGLLVAIYPAGRILHARVGPDPQAAPHLEMAYIVCRQIEMVLLVFSLAGLLTGAIVEANKDYPTDPFPLLVAIWLLALLGLLAGAVMGFAHWVQLFRRRSPPQPLDDPPPPPPAPDRVVRFGADRF